MNEKGKFSGDPYVRRFQEEEAKDPKHSLHGLGEAEKIAKDAVIKKRREEREKAKKDQESVKLDGSNHPENNILSDGEKSEIDSHPAVEKANDIVFRKEDDIEGEKLSND